MNENLEALIIFARVAEMKSFTQAAESLGIQKGRASLVVRELERRQARHFCIAPREQCS